jgi:Fe-S cluster assembly protein SufD
MTETMMTTENSYLRDFTGTDSGSNAPSPEWLRNLRQSAAARFAEVGFPTRRNEEWRFTNISPIAETPFALATKAESEMTTDALARYTYAGMGGTQLVFVNGHFQADLSSREFPAGVTVSTLSAAMETSPELIEVHLGRYAKFTTQAFVALNTAALEDGAFVHLSRNAVVDEAIHLLFISTPHGGPTVSHPRTLIIADENAQATIVESYSGTADGVYFTNAVTEIVAAENAILDHYKVQRESVKAYHVATMQLQLARSTNFSSHSVGLGGLLVRNDANAYLGGEGIECTLNGVYLGNDRQLIDNHTEIDHAMPHCNSHEIYKGILDGHSRGVFNGKIFVREDAQKTDAKQTNQTLLLSPTAQIDTKPQLEIFADDVKCTHGATIGQLSDEALFYLRARGISKDNARALLTYAFASDIVSRIKIDAIRAQLDQVLLADRALQGIAL